MKMTPNNPLANAKRYERLAYRNEANCLEVISLVILWLKYRLTASASVDLNRQVQVGCIL